MKVKELLEVLQKSDPESYICFAMDDGCCGDWLDLEAYEARLLDYYPPNLPQVQVHFVAVPGYHSCISSSGIKNRHQKVQSNPSQTPPDDTL
jgi:hypothetical protein